MGDFQVDNWMDLADLDLDQIVVKDQGGRFDDELVFFTTQNPKELVKSPATVGTDKEEDDDDSILNTLDCKSRKEDSDSDDGKIIDYSKLLD